MAKKIKKSKKAKSENIEYEASSGNVFADFEFPSPEEADAKSDLAILISSIIKQRNLTQKEAADLMEIDQPKVSKITRGLLSEFTIERLMNYLVKLGYDVEIKATNNNAVIPSIHVVKDKLRETKNRAYRSSPRASRFGCFSEDQSDEEFS